MPDLYDDGLQAFSVEEEWADGDLVVKGATKMVSPQVVRTVSALRAAAVYQVPADRLPPACFLFVIPKSPEKVSLILSCVKENRQDGVKTPIFRLVFLAPL